MSGRRKGSRTGAYIPAEPPIRDVAPSRRRRSPPRRQPDHEWTSRSAARASRQKPPPRAASPSEDDPLSTVRGSSDEDAQDFSDSESFTDERIKRHPESIQRQPLRIVDWRGEMCRFLGLDMKTSDDTVLEELAKTEIILQEEAQRARSDAYELEDVPPKGQVIYRIQCAESPKSRQDLYMEEPWISRSGPNQSHLRAGDAIRNFELFLERAKDISFVVYKDFDCCSSEPAQSPMRGFYDFPSSPIANHFVSEKITIVSQDLSNALQALSRGPLTGIKHPQFEVDSKSPNVYPYLWWYNRRDEIAQFEEQLERIDREHIGVFKEYLLRRLGQDWDTVDNLISKGKITSQYVEYLFIPGTVVISKMNGETHNRIRGAAAESWLFVWRGSHDPSEISGSRRLGTFATIGCLQWSFDGNFQQDSHSLRIKNFPLEKDQEINITDLDVYPARFAEADLLRGLQERGEMYWKCRQRRYVCYNDTVEDTMHVAAAQRFMVDISIYKEMHPPEAADFPKRNDLGSADLTQDEPPLGEAFLLCLPTTIPGFNMQKKEWVTLEVGNIKDVEWNRDAFEMLVADEETKELVRALVENHCSSEKNTDLISGKGNGLFVLLHGAPGTGKTSTAETVAEIAEKPLYRVTCGDIGTKAEDVEKYLETVLLLGKTWGCVVLLDEADVFLEERTLFDLQRNALVSVFLRVLEYYEGILILTSNRVGIFDEAFKSRIQLTLRYKNLEEPQRKKIWDNMITRLEQHQNIRSLQQNRQLHSAKLQNSNNSQEKEIDFKDIFANIDQLASVDLNGRQIRNALSTARQLAMFRGKSMQFSHLKVVINESEKFDAYLKEVTGLSADLIQRDKGLR